MYQYFAAADDQKTDSAKRSSLDVNMHPVIQESASSPGTDGAHFKLPPLGHDKMAITNDSRAHLDLPKLKKRRGSIDSGFRTSSSYAGSDIDTPVSNDTSMSRFSSNRSSTVTAVFVKQDSANLEEVESIASMEGGKDERDSRRMLRRRSLTGSQSIKCVTPHTSLASMNSDRSGAVEERGQSSENQEEEEDDDDDRLVHIIPPKGWLKIIAYIVFLPLIILLFFTLPNVKQPVSLSIRLIS